jgi:hypothetical protein
MDDMHKTVTMDDMNETTTVTMVDKEETKVVKKLLLMLENVGEWYNDEDLHYVRTVSHKGPLMAFC